jgi:hypothetical protein
MISPAGTKFILGQFLLLFAERTPVCGERSEVRSTGLVRTYLIGWMPRSLHIFAAS